MKRINQFRPFLLSSPCWFREPSGLMSYQYPRSRITFMPQKKSFGVKKHQENKTHFKHSTSLRRPISTKELNTSVKSWDRQLILKRTSSPFATMIFCLTSRTPGRTYLERWGPLLRWMSLKPVLTRTIRKSGTLCSNSLRSKLSLMSSTSLCCSSSSHFTTCYPSTWVIFTGKMQGCWAPLDSGTITFKNTNCNWWIRINRTSKT